MNIASLLKAAAGIGQLLIAAPVLYNQIFAGNFNTTNFVLGLVALLSGGHAAVSSAVTDPPKR